MHRNGDGERVEEERDPSQRNLGTQDFVRLSALWPTTLPRPRKTVYDWMGETPSELVTVQGDGRPKGFACLPARLKIREKWRPILSRAGAVPGMKEIKLIGAAEAAP